MSHKIICCDGPLSLFAASSCISIYIVAINILHVSAATLHVYGKHKVISTKHFIFVNFVTMMMCCLLSVAGVLFVFGSLLRIKCILKWMAPLFFALVSVRLASSVLLFMESKHYARLVGDISSGVVQMYASYLFWKLYKESKRRKLCQAMSAPKVSVKGDETKNTVP